MGYRARTFSTHINMGEARCLENIYMEHILFHSLLCIIFTLDTICADNKDKPMAGCKNQLIKKCLRNFSS